MLKRRSFITVLVTFSLMMLLAVSSTSPVFASKSSFTHHENNADIEAAPNSIYYEETGLYTPTPGPGSYEKTLNKHGASYKGTLYKINEQVDPDGPYYLTVYGGTLYKQ